VGTSDKLGLQEDPTLTAYLEYGGAENLRQMLRFLAQRDLGLPVRAEPPRPVPQAAMWVPGSDALYEQFSDYAAAFHRRGAGPAGPPPGGGGEHPGPALGGRRHPPRPGAGRRR
jgi:cobaltochelatase CobN